jgi:hypothetical protein
MNDSFSSAAFWRMTPNWDAYSISNCMVTASVEHPGNVDGVGLGWRRDGVLGFVQVDFGSRGECDYFQTRRKHTRLSFVTTLERNFLDSGRSMCQVISMFKRDKEGTKTGPLYHVISPQNHAAQKSTVSGTNSNHYTHKLEEIGLQGSK